MSKLWTDIFITINQKQNQANSAIFQHLVLNPQSQQAQDNPSYSQEEVPLKSNNFVVQEQEKQQFTNIKIKNTIRKKKKVLSKVDKKQKIKTQPTYVIPKKSKNFSQRISKPNIDEQKLYQQRSELKVIFQRKIKLQQKLKRLNNELQGLTKERKNSIQRYEYINQSKQSSKSKGSASLVHSRISRHFYRIQEQTQIEKSRKAVEFVEKMNIDHRARKVKYLNRLNKMKVDKTLKHVCIECSRSKCQAQIIQGQLQSNYK